MSTIEGQTIAVIVVAAGRGERASANGDNTPKQYRRVGGKAVIERSIRAMLAEPRVRWVLPVLHADHLRQYDALGLTDERLLAPVAGGATRQASVLAGLEALAAEAPDLVLIHDAARPFAASATISATIDALASHPGALPVVPVTDTIKRSEDGRTVAATEAREKLYSAQTPQGFRFSDILAAHRRAATVTEPFTDDASIAEWAGLTVALIPGSTENFKITHPDDFARAERLIGASQAFETRVGTGFDVHQFDAGDAVWLGGVRIPHTHRLKGHSDADVALHALCDAIYGALGEGDIGAHFPPSEAEWKDVASTLFLAHAAGRVAARHGRIVNLDVTIVCEAPRIGPHVAEMKEAIARTCHITPGRVAIKATTSEELGFTGRREGIVAMASASIELPREDF